MISVGLSAGAWAFIGLTVSAIVAPTWLSWWNARQARLQVRPNGGTSLRDAIDRIERQQEAQHHAVMARLDHGAAVSADHADRIAVLEASRRRTAPQKRAPRKGA